MATTSIPTSHALAKRVWIEDLYRDSLKKVYFNKFMSEKGESIVYVKSDLAKDKGDTIKFFLRPKLSGPGVSGETRLKGNEEKLDFYNQDLVIDLYRHAVDEGSIMSKQRTSVDVSDEAKQAIGDWMTEKIESMMFSAISSSPTRVVYTTSSGHQTATSAATAKSALTLADSKLTLSQINFIKTYAKTGANRAFIPVEPVRVNGKEYFVLLTHDHCLYDLKETSAYQQAMREARERSAENPLFTGADAIWEGVVIHSNEQVTKGTDAGAGSNVNFAVSTLLGKKALQWGWGKRPWMASEEDDYGMIKGHAINVICGTQKSKFNSEDFGSVALYNARTNVA